MSFVCKTQWFERQLGWKVRGFDSHNDTKFVDEMSV